MTPDNAPLLVNQKSSLALLLYRLRVYLLCLSVITIFSLIAPKFLTSENIAALFKGTSVGLYAAIGFTLVMLIGQLDLSVGVTMSLGGMLAIGLQPQLGWTGSVAVAVFAGATIGWINGYLVAKAKINSFIVTLGTMTIMGGAINIYSNGGTLSVDDYRLSDWLDRALIDGLPITFRVLMAVALLVVSAVALSHTAFGRAFYLIGGNRQTAWYSGLAVDAYIIGAFVISATLSAFGGAIFAIGLNSSNPTMGDKSLMLIIAAVIIGGTSMNGGRGTVIQTGVAMLTLVALINGLGCMGAGYEAQLFVTGIVLAVVVLYDAMHNASKERIRGQRKELLQELNQLAEERTTDMQSKDNSFAMVCMTTVGCVAIVAIFAMWFTQQQRGVVAIQPSTVNAPATSNAAQNTSNVTTGNEVVDVSKLLASDGQPLIAMDDAALVAPPRPINPNLLPEDDAQHWYDREYAGWNIKKEPMPKPPAGGARGKHVICLRFIDHPYLTAYTKGMQQVADAYGITLKTLVANNDINIQAQQVDQAINDKPDLVIITPVDATAVVPLLRKMHQAGIPVIASNLLPVDQGMPYVMTWTGPDDWGNFRELAREFAKRMNYEGGYCVVRHMPGTGTYFSRTFSFVTELKKIAPKMKCLDMQPTGLEALKTMQVTADWITRFGPELKGIASGDDAGTVIGINQAIERANRNDIIRVAAGNSKVGMDAVKAGTLAVISYQSAEADGALPMKLAADYFNGKPIDRPVYYLKKALITKENVNKFMPAQW